MEIKIINKSNNELPKYQTPGSSGMDICAYLPQKSIELYPNEPYAIPTGLYVELPVGYEIQIRARSGLALKYGLTMANGVGTIDSDFRGEIKVILINLGKKQFTVNNGDRIAQMIVSKYEIANLKTVAELNDSIRGEGGFGHSGI